MFKKCLLVSVGIFCNLYLFGQKESPMVFDPFENVSLNFKVLDSNTVKGKKYRFNKKYPNIAVYEAINQVNIAYCVTDRNKWYSIFQDKIEFVMGYKIENLDNENLPEVILYWQEYNYGSNGGTSTDWMSIIRLDSVPIQIFKVCLGCNEESFGNKEKNGDGAYYFSYIRTTRVTSNAIIFESNDRKKYPYEDCQISNIPAGKYKMKAGQIVKIN